MSKNTFIPVNVFYRTPEMVEKMLGDHCRYPLKRGIPHPQNPNKQILAIFVPESDLYRLIAHSRLPAAEKFERWVFDEVLPNVCKHGMYATPEAVVKMLGDHCKDVSKRDTLTNGGKQHCKGVRNVDTPVGTR